MNEKKPESVIEEHNRLVRTREGQGEKKHKKQKKILRN